MDLTGDPEQIQEARQNILAYFEDQHRLYIDNQVEVYDDQFSEEAINDSIAFYTSSSGREVIAKMPVINDRLVDLGAAFSKDIMIALNDMFVEFDDGTDDEGY